MNRWTLTDEVKAKYTPIVEEFIKEVENSDPEADFLEKDFSDTELNPYTLWQLMESLGYKQGYLDTNGWEMDFWIPFTKENCKPLVVSGCGITFTLTLAETDE